MYVRGVHMREQRPMFNSTTVGVVGRKILNRPREVSTAVNAVAEQAAEEFEG